MALMPWTRMTHVFTMRIGTTSSTGVDWYYLIERISGSELGNSLMQCGKTM
jgi:hypothetical protein